MIRSDSLSPSKMALVLFDLVYEGAFEISMFNFIMNSGKMELFLYVRVCILYKVKEKGKGKMFNLFKYI